MRLPVPTFMASVRASMMAGMGKQYASHLGDVNGSGGAAASRRGGPRRLSRAAKLAIIEASFADGAIIASVARRHETVAAICMAVGRTRQGAAS